MRSAVFLLPILASIGVSVGLSKAAPSPDNVIQLGLIWLVIIVASTATLMSVEKVARKALPLAAMLSLTMVFPDQSPSRFRTALRSGSSVKNLRAILAEAESVDDNSPAKSAELVLQLATALNTHDPRTRGHAERVRAYTEMLAEEMNIGDEDRAKLRWASLLHDIGKLKVSTDILNKPGKLDDDEWEQIKLHPVFGEEICGPLLDWLGPWAGAVVDHHERFDGNGYPHGKAGSEISQAGRIVCVADAYDVMTTVRSYKEPMSTAEARQELARHAGAQFDPKVVRTFLNLSMGRLRWIAGPLSWLAQLPFLQGLAGVAQSVGSTVGVAAVATGGAAAALTTGVVTLPGSGPLELPEPPPALVQFVDTQYAPVARDDFATATQDARRVIDVLNNDALSSIDTLAIVVDPSFGTVIVNADGTVTYIPSGEYVGEDEFVYEVIDSGGQSTTATVVITVVGVNDAPIVRGDSATVDEDDAVDIDVLANDSDADGAIAAIELVGQPSNGVATLNSNLTVNYRPDADFFGSDLITYVAIDEDGARSEGTVAVVVRPVNDPVVDPGPGTLVAAGGKTVRFDPLALAVDKDGDTVFLAWFDSISIAGGTVVEGSLIYTPPYAYSGSDSFRYALSDGIVETVVTVRLDVRGTPDTAGPTITLLGPNPLVLNIGDEFTDPGAQVADADPSFKPSFIVDATAVDTSKAGSYLVVYTSTDPTGNTSTRTRTVVVEDPNGPQLLVKGSNPLTMEAGQLYVEAGATASDAKDGDLTASVIVDASLLNAGRPGTYTVSYRVTDSDGKQATAQRTVKVIDTTKPKIVLKGADPQTIEAGGAYVELGATAADNDTSFAASAVPDASGVDASRPGTYTVTYSVSDSSGNSANPAVRTVNVVDTTKPVITLQGANPQNIETGNPYVELGATATDNDATFTASPTADTSGVNTSVSGTYTVVYTVADASGNTTTKNRTVVVGDITPPVVTPTGANPQVIEAGSAYVELGATATDNDPTFAAVPSADSSSVNTSVPGSYSVVYSVTDPSGNTGTANRTVAVVDTTAPVITVIGSNPQVIEAGSAYVELGATATDNDATFSATPTANSSGVNTSVPGSYSVSYSVTDPSGNTGTANRSVTVVDTTAPVITVIGSNPQVIEAGAAYVELGATATDNDATFSTTPTANSSGVNTSIPGSYSVSYSVTDPSGNIGTANRTVAVVDTTAPVISPTGANPQVIEAGAPYVELGATATDNDATFGGVPAADASGVDTSTPGSYLVAYSVTDPSGNIGTANRTVAVVDTTDPVITVTGADPQTIEAGSSYSELGASATDNDASFSASPVPDASGVDTATPGSYIVVYSVTDPSGNTGTASRGVDVVDTTPPVVTASQTGAVLETATVGTTVMTVAATDTVGVTGFTIVGGSPTFSIDAAGVIRTLVLLDHETTSSYGLSITATDDAGNTSAAETVTVDVDDVNEPPIAVNDGGFSTTTDVTISIDSADLLSNDSDPDAESPIFDDVVSTTTTQGGTIEDPESDGVYLYTPPAGVDGITDTFDYRIRDALGLTDTATVSISIGSAVSDPALTSIDPASSPASPIQAVVGQETRIDVYVQNLSGDPAPGVEITVTVDSADFLLVNSGGCSQTATEVVCLLGKVNSLQIKSHKVELVPQNVGSGWALPVVVTMNGSDTDGTNNSGTIYLDVTPTPLLVSEFATEGPGDFIELYNAGTSDIDIAGLEVRLNGAGVSDITLAGADTVLAPGEHFLLADDAGDLDGAADQTFAFDLPADLGIRIRDASGVVDEVGTGTSSWFEGAALPAMVVDPTTEQSYERLDSSTSGSCVDTGDNGADFIRHWDHRDPQATDDLATPCGAPLYVVSADAGVVVVNELLYSQTGAKDEFIELYNAGGSDYDLTGLRLTDSSPFTGHVDPNDPLDFTIPATDLASNPSTLPPGGIAVIWLQEDGGDTGAALHYNVDEGDPGVLSNVADEVWLVDTSGAIVDYVAYGAANTGERDTPIPDALGMWNAAGEAALGGVAAGTSIALTPSGLDSDDSACWEVTGTGTSSCGPGTVDLDAAAGRVTSVGSNNNNLVADVAFHSSVPAGNLANPVQVTTGVPMTIDITAENRGPSQAPASKVLLPLATGEFAFNGGPSSPGCAYDAVDQEVTCSIGVLASGNSETVTIGITPLLPGSYTLALSVNSVSATDPDLTNNAGAISVDVVPTPTHVVISEFSTDRATDFVELYNPTSAPVLLDGYTLRVYPPDGTAGFTVEATIPLASSTFIPANGYFLIGNTPDLAPVAADHAASFDVAQYGGVEIADALGAAIDGAGTAPRPGGGPNEQGAASSEGNGVAAMNPGPNEQSMQRRHGDGLGSCIDTDDNASDFVHNNGGVSPKNTSTVEACGTPPLPPPSSAAGVVISEIRTDGPNGGGDEMIEIFNAGPTSVDLLNWELQVGDGFTLIFRFNSLILEPGQHFLFATASSGLTADTIYGPGGTSIHGTLFTTDTVTNGAAVRIVDGGGTPIDTVGFDGPPAEGNSLPSLSTRGPSYERRGGGAYGSCVDTGDNLSDFYIRSVPDPQTLGDPFAICL
ncbi:MAG: DUF5011 domain-containing protein [Acidimicrobiia bacterium]|nr:DUF5011 domain-containing protein [Acidimicrobiia bacterium]